MPFDVICWSEAAPGTGTPGITGAAGDRTYDINGDGIKIQSKAPWLLGLSYLAESTPGYCRLEQSSLKPYHYFVRTADLNDPSHDGSLVNLSGRPLYLFPGEYCYAYSNNATDEDTIITGLVGDGWVTQAALDAVQPTAIIRGYADQALTANTWTNVTLTWDATPPAGRYAVVGLLVGSYIAAGFMQGAARLVLKETTWRPGVPLVQAEGDKLVVAGGFTGHGFPYHWPLMREISFVSPDAMPNLEICSPAALTDHVVQMLIQRI